jgi:protein-S-isoprenylcysteine O-methyltransferase Ste14
MGITIILAAILSFRRLQTTINPLQPDKATSLVVSGIFRLSRNPMYLGMLLILIAVSLASGAVVGLFLLPAFIAYISFFQILPEEKAMRELFSDQYAEYCKKVRRWI